MERPEDTIRTSVESGLATVRIGRAHGNAINEDLVEGLCSTFENLRLDRSVRGVALASRGKLFCPGLDLQELQEYDRPALERFMRRFGACLMAIYTFPRPVVAALGGHALAGGCVLALTADCRILRRGAMVGLNEIKVGVPLPFGVAQILRETVHRTRLEEVALLGRNYRDEEAVVAGLVHEVREAAGFEDRCRERLEEFASKDPDAFATTKRYLRSGTAERIRADEGPLLGEFLDLWFSEATQVRIRGIVAELKGKSRGDEE